MKKLFLVGGLLCAGAGAAQGQEYEVKYPAPKEPYGATPKAGVEAVAPFKKANLILVYPLDSAKTAIKQMAILLQQNGFAVDRLDYDLLSVSTKPKAVGSSVYNASVLAVWNKDHLEITGQWTGQAMGLTVQEPIAYTNPTSRQIFTEVQKIALAYPNARVAYAQRL